MKRRDKIKIKFILTLIILQQKWLSQEKGMVLIYQIQKQERYSYIYIIICNKYMQLLNDIQNDSESSYDGKDESQNKSNSNVKRRFMNKEMNEIDEKQMFIPPDWGFKDIKSYLDNEGYDTKSMNEAQLRVYILNYL